MNAALRAEEQRAELWEHLHSDAHPEVAEVSDSSLRYVRELHDALHSDAASHDREDLA